MSVVTPEPAEALAAKIVSLGYRLYVRDGVLKRAPYTPGTEKEVPENILANAKRFKDEIRVMAQADQKTVAGWMHEVLKAVMVRYPACTGCDLTPFQELLHKAESRYEDQDVIGCFYALRLAVRRGYDICDQCANYPVLEAQLHEPVRSG